MVLSQAKQIQMAQEFERMAIRLNVMSKMHGMLCAHLDGTGKFTTAERLTWEREVMVPAFAAQGITLVEGPQPAPAPAQAPSLLVTPSGAPAVIPSLET